MYKPYGIGDITQTADTMVASRESRQLPDNSSRLHSDSSGSGNNVQCSAANTTPTTQTASPPVSQTGPRGLTRHSSTPAVTNPICEPFFLEAHGSFPQFQPGAGPSYSHHPPRPSQRTIQGKPESHDGFHDTTGPPLRSEVGNIDQDLDAYIRTRDAQMDAGIAARREQVNSYLSSAPAFRAYLASSPRNSDVMKSWDPTQLPPESFTVRQLCDYPSTKHDYVNHGVQNPLGDSMLTWAKETLEKTVNIWEQHKNGVAAVLQLPPLEQLRLQQAALGPIAPPQESRWSAQNPQAFVQDDEAVTCTDNDNSRPRLAHFVAQLPRRENGRRLPLFEIVCRVEHIARTLHRRRLFEGSEPDNGTCLPLGPSASARPTLDDHISLVNRRAEGAWTHSVEHLKSALKFAQSDRPSPVDSAANATPSSNFEPRVNTPTLSPDNGRFSDYGEPPTS